MQSTVAAALAYDQPSAASKSLVYLCYGGHVEKTMGVVLRDILRDNCLTILENL